MDYAKVIAAINRAASQGNTFFFALDYEQKEGIFLAEPLQEGADLGGIRFSIGSYQTPETSSPKPMPRLLNIQAEPQECYRKRFEHIYQGIQHGDSFLANLTIRTPIELSEPSLETIYEQSKARYKVLIPGRCVCFSPECFIQIKGHSISTYPMKGTIDAGLEGASQLLLADYKEHCEHCTIVDLMRNDLSRIAEGVRVERFKYLDHLTTSRGDILQMSSEVRGNLPMDWSSRLGDLIHQLLPAGSISGAPKERTCQLIREAEGKPRGYYTGICGYFDGETLDTAVMIRFIEQEGKHFYYRSGGGITINSEAEAEYQECLQKVYLPQ